MRSLVTFTVLLLSCTAENLQRTKRDSSSSNPNLPALINDLGLTTLSGLLDQEGLSSTLASGGPYTVFGPTNDAFTSVPADQANTALDDLLTYHVVAGMVYSDNISNELVITSSDGNPIRFNAYDNGVVTAQCSPIDLTRVDQMASNGLVHVVNRVMGVPQGSIFDVVNTTANFSTLAAAVGMAGLDTLLSSNGNLTLFAPTNDAFNKVPSDFLTSLLSNQTQLMNVLSYHAVDCTLCSAGLSMMNSVTALNGDSLAIKVKNGAVKVNSANVEQADYSVTNGVMHSIDTVLIPPP